MPGTLKAWLALPGLWVVGAVGWLFMLTVCAVASGKSHGTALMVAMGTAWGSALLLSIAVVALGGVLLWRWMTPGVGRILLLVTLAAVQAATLLMEVFSVFIAFDR